MGTFGSPQPRTTYLAGRGLRRVETSVGGFYSFEEFHTFGERGLREASEEAIQNRLNGGKK